MEYPWLKKKTFSGDPSADANLLRDCIHEIATDNCLCYFPNGIDKYSPDEIYALLAQCGVLESEQRHITLEHQVERRRYWEIRHDPENANSYAYAKTRQPLHTDNAWFSNPPELNLFIMLQQASHGGESTILPIALLQKLMLAIDPDLYSDLCSVQVSIQKAKDIEPNVTSIIDLNREKLNWNYYRTVRSSEKIERMCQHFFDFLEAREAAGDVPVLRFQTGDVYLMPDTKFLHGRLAFEEEVVGERRLLQAMWYLKNQV